MGILTSSFHSHRGTTRSSLGGYFLGVSWSYRIVLLMENLETRDATRLSLGILLDSLVALSVTAWPAR